MTPSDQNVRDKFTQEWERNFSVIAPAGSGKTKAIIDRVIHIASLETALAKRLLPKLVVVTYTNKAAKEMQQRARREIAQRQIDPVAVGFNRAFFGTIHSFCLLLLNQHGHHIGLPSKLELLPENDEEMWQAFIGQWQEPWNGDEADVLQYLSIFDVFAMARKLKPCEFEQKNSLPPPVVDLTGIETCPIQAKTKNTIARGLSLARGWKKRQGFRPLPEFNQGGAEFQKRWRQSFAPLQNWIKKEALQLAHAIARQYQHYRLTRGCLTYRDQTQLAAQLLQHVEAGRQIRAQNYRIILDEAQDTDTDQFRVLFETARPAESKGEWLQGSQHPPRAGFFCMVGDPQQSIYGDRADPVFYAHVRRKLEESGAEELTFHVTFRCDHSIIQTVNRHGPCLLDGKDGQTEYVVLQPSQQAQDGQTARLKIESPWNEEEKKKEKDFSLAQYEAQILAQWIQEAGLEKLRARDWSQVAILCPRRRWFQPLVDALQKVGLETQIQSSREKMRDSVFYSWLTALAVVMNQPRNSFEIVGVLREFYGLSDQSLADFSKGEGSLFQIQEKVAGTGTVENKLNELHFLREEIMTLPLRDAAARLARIAHQRARALPLTETDDACVDMILARAAQAEENGFTFAAWAENMRRGAEEEKTETEARPHAIQLITCQKAKGLEWDA
ncbi:MAG: UvrD-helicase domain-containing protein, partial [bacterium]